MFIVQEAVNGTTLPQYINKPKKMKLLIEESRINKIVICLTVAIKEIHGRSVVHRDIKSLNIFLLECWIIKFGGFSVATLFEEDEITEEIIGNPLYSVPEVWTGDPYTNKWDL